MLCKSCQLAERIIQINANHFLHTASYDPGFSRLGAALVLVQEWSSAPIHVSIQRKFRSYFQRNVVIWRGWRTWVGAEVRSCTSSVIGAGNNNGDGVIGTGSKNDDGIIGGGNNNDEGVIGAGNSNDDGVIGTGNKNDHGVIGAGNNDDGSYAAGNSDDGTTSVNDFGDNMNDINNTNNGGDDKHRSIVLECVYPRSKYVSWFWLHYISIYGSILCLWLIWCCSILPIRERYDFCALQAAAASSKFSFCLMNL